MKFYTFFSLVPLSENDQHNLGGGLGRPMKGAFINEKILKKLSEYVPEATVKTVQEPSNSFLIMIFSLFIFCFGSCGKRNFSDTDAYLMVTSSYIYPSEPINIYYFYPDNRLREEKPFFIINNTPYYRRLLSWGRDDFPVISCCILKKLDRSFDDIQKVIDLYPGEKFDSIDKKYAAIQHDFYKDFDRLGKETTHAIEKNKAIIRFFKANNIEFCECEYRYPTLLIEQGLIKRLNDFKKTDKNDILFTDNTLKIIFSDSLINTELHYIDQRFE